MSIASHADVLRGSSRVPAPRGAGTLDEPLRTSAWEARMSMQRELYLNKAISFYGPPCFLERATEN